MLLNKSPPLTGPTPPNRVGVADGGKNQHGGAARGVVDGGGALLVGGTSGKGTHPRCAVPDDGLASQACGAGVATARCRERSSDPARAQPPLRRNDQGRADGRVG